MSRSTVNVLELLAEKHPEHRAYLDMLGPKYALFRGVTMKKPDDDGDDDEDDDEDDEPDEEITVGNRTFKTSELQRIMADEKRQGQRSGQRKLVEDLGFKDVDEARAFVERVREEERAKESEAERREREARERETAAERREREADEKARKADLRAALREAGAKGDDLDDAFILLDRKIERDYDEDDLQTEVEKLVTRRPALFAADDETPAPRRPAAQIPGGRPGQRPAPKGRQFGAEGLRRAERRFGKRDA